MIRPQLTLVASVTCVCVCNTYVAGDAKDWFHTGDIRVGKVTEGAYMHRSYHKDHLRHLSLRGRITTGIIYIQKLITRNIYVGVNASIPAAVHQCSSFLYILRHFLYSRFKISYNINKIILYLPSTAGILKERSAFRPFHFLCHTTSVQY